MQDCFQTLTEMKKLLMFRIYDCPGENEALNTCQMKSVETLTDIEPCIIADKAAVRVLTLTTLAGRRADGSMKR